MTRRSLSFWIGYSVSAVVVGVLGFQLALQTSPETYPRMVRVVALLVCGGFAVGFPHVLLPDPFVRRLLLLNPSPARLLGYQVVRSLPFIVLPVALLVLLSLITGVRPEGLAISFGVFFIGLFAVDRYVSLGPRSQEWQEGKRGARMRALQEETGESLFVPDGLVPSLLTTFQVALFGLLLIVATVYAGRLSPVLLLFPSLLFGVGLMVHLIRFRSGFDRWFYATHALYSELFRSAGGLEVSDRAPVGISSLYWVPGRVRPHVWLRLVQLDRRLPMGRVLAAAYVGLCGVFAISPDPLLRLLGLAVIVLGKNAAVGLVSNQALAPQPFLSTFESTGGAVLSRLFVNLRWTLPWVILLAVLVVFADGFGGYEMVVWTSLDIAAAVLFAWSFAFVPSIRLRYA